MTTHTVDTFAGTAGTALESHTPDSGGPYTQVDGDSGKLQLSGSGGLNSVSTTNTRASYVVPVGTTDMYAQITLGATGATWATSVICPAVRVQDKDNHYRLERTGASQVRIVKRVSGSDTTLSIITATINGSDVFKIDAVGSTITAYRNGSSIGSASDSSLSTQTNAGFVTVGGNASNNFSRFESDAIGGGGSPAPRFNPASTLLTLGVG